MLYETDFGVPDYQLDPPPEQEEQEEEVDEYGQPICVPPWEMEV